MRRDSWLDFWKYPWRAALVIFIADQAVKWWIVQTIDLSDKREVIPGFFDIVHYANPGGAWGVLGDHTEILSLISLGFAWLVAAKFRQMHEGHFGRAIGLMLLAGGVWGNLFDRLFRSDAVLGRGEVVDYISVFLPIGEKGYHYPAFNIADSAICCGVFLYIACSMIPSLLRGSAPAHE